MPSSLAETIALELGAQEPWPNDVKLYQPYAVEQILLPDNANCLAVQAFLHMCGLPFQIEQRANAEFMSPSGKVPFIKCGAFVVSELKPIVQFVGNKGITLTSELDSQQKSDLRAYMSTIHTVLENAELYMCWCDKATYNEVTVKRSGSVYPWPLNYLHTWTKRAAVTDKLKVLEWYQKDLDSVYKDVENCCQALSERLEGKEYFFGSKPCELDALLYGHIFSILSTPLSDSQLITRVMNYPNLLKHCKKICCSYNQHTSIIISEKKTSSSFITVNLQPDMSDIELTMKKSNINIIASESDMILNSCSDLALNSSMSSLNLEPVNVFLSSSELNSSEEEISEKEIKRTEQKINCSVLDIHSKTESYLSSYYTDSDDVIRVSSENILSSDVYK